MGIQKNLLFHRLHTSLLSPFAEEKRKGQKVGECCFETEGDQGTYGERSWWKRKRTITGSATFTFLLKKKEKKKKKNTNEMKQNESSTI